MYSAKEVREIAHVVNGINVDQMRATVRSIRRDPAKAKATRKATTMWKEGSYVQTRIRDPCASGSTTALVPNAKATRKR
jgi:hypothetical protein